MLGCKCLTWTRVAGLLEQQPETFSLPAPIPQWPQGMPIPHFSVKFLICFNDKVSIF